MRKFVFSYNRRLLRGCYAILLCLILFIPASVRAATDGYILTDPIANTYTGRAGARQLIESLKYPDLPEDSVSIDAVIRGTV